MLALAFAAMSVIGCAHARAPVAVRVGQKFIIVAQVAHWTLVLASAERKGRHERRRARDSALAFLIKARWLEGGAREAHVTVTAAEAARKLSLVEYARLRGLPAVPFEWESELRPYLSSPRATASDRLWLMTLSVLRAKLHRHLLSRAEEIVTRSQIERRYRASRARFYLPETRDVAIVESYSRAAMIRARRELAAGAAPQVVAKRFSIDPVYPTGEVLGYVRGTGAPALDAAIFSARPRTVVGPLQVTMHYVFEVLSVRRRRALALAQVAGTIKRELAEKAPSEALERSSQREWTARTDCRPGYTVPGCRQYRAGRTAAREPPLVRPSRRPARRAASGSRHPASD